MGGDGGRCGDGGQAASVGLAPAVPPQAIVRLWVAGGGDSAGRITPPDRPGTPSSLAQPALALQESNASLSSQSMVSPESSALGTAADPLQHAQRRRRMRAIQLAVKWNRPLVVEAIFSEAAPPEGGRAIVSQRTRSRVGDLQGAAQPEGRVHKVAPAGAAARARVALLETSRAHARLDEIRRCSTRSSCAATT